MTEPIKKPYGHSTMIILGFVTQIFGILIFLGSILASFFVENFFNDYGPVQNISFFIFVPIIVILEIILLFKLKNKNVQGIYMLKFILPFNMFLGTLVLIEGFVGPYPSQIAEIITILLNIIVLIYWNNPSHLHYFRSLGKTS